MQKIKKLIILSVIILIIIIATLIAIKITKKNVIQDGVAPFVYKLEKTVQPVDDRLDFFGVQDCVEKYYLYYVRTFNAKEYYLKTFGSRNDNTEAIQQYEQKSAIVLYNMLDEEFIKTKEVTTENIKTKLSEIKLSDINITNIYVSRKNEKISVYLVQGILKEEDTNKSTQFQIIMKVDEDSRTFKIIPQQYVEEKYNNIEIGKEIDISVPESIIENDNNKFKYRIVNDETYLTNLMDKLKNEIKYYPELVYNKLDEEYRNKKFATLNEFITYINNNKEKFDNMQLEKYSTNITEDYTQYVCVDKNGNYYIFQETAVMQYDLMLDKYTINISDFIKKYDSSDSDVKVALNIEKLIEASRDRDYKYVYNKLDTTFKSTNFVTLEAFENFIKQKFNPVEDTIEYTSYQEITGVHVYNIEVTDISENKRIKAKVVMQLKDDRDFVFSFSAEN